MRMEISEKWLRKLCLVLAYKSAAALSAISFQFPHLGVQMSSTVKGDCQMEGRLFQTYTIGASWRTVYVSECLRG
jgi:hypothetical protein